jgi:hypothetical protein
MGQTMGIALLGALWASRVSSYEGTLRDAGAIEASALSQVGGLSDTMWVVVLLIFLAFLIGLVSLVMEQWRARSSLSA